MKLLCKGITSTIETIEVKKETANGIEGIVLTGVHKGKNVYVSKMNIIEDTKKTEILKTISEKLKSSKEPFVIEFNSKHYHIHHMKTNYAYRVYVTNNGVVSIHDNFKQVNGKKNFLNYLNDIL